MGKVVGVHGIKGNLKIRSYAESPDFFYNGQPLILKNTDEPCRTVRIKRVQHHGRGLLMLLEGIGTRDQARVVVGANLMVERAQLPELEVGVYYWADLIGLTVYGKDSACLGVIADIMTTGGNDVYVVKPQNDTAGRERLIPAIETVVTEIDVKRGIMIVDLPEGL
jgi:16S rRNA processing protein RimM